MLYCTTMKERCADSRFKNLITLYAQDRNTVLVRFFGMTDTNPAKDSLSTYNFPLKKE